MSHFSATNRIDYVVQLAEATQRDSILTVGVANIPDIEKKLSLVAKHCTIVDIDSKKLAHARAKLPRVSVIHGDITNSSLFANQKFSMVIMLEVLEHLADDFGNLKKLARLLPKKGKLIISVPNTHPLHMFNPLRYTQHKRHYSLSDITHLLKRAGFSIDYTNTVESPKMLLDLYAHLFCKYVLKRTLPFGFLTGRTDKTYRQHNSARRGLDSIIVAVKH